MAVNPFQLGYDPQQDGPPTWSDSGNGTAKTLDEFNSQAEIFRTWLVSSGLGTQVTPGGAITNAVPYFPGSPSPTDIRAYLNDPVGLGPVASQPTENLMASPFGPGSSTPEGVGFIPNPGNFGGVGPLSLDSIQQIYGGLPSNPSTGLNVGGYIPQGTGMGSFGGSYNPLTAGQVGTVINTANPCQYVPEGPLKVACQIAQGVYNAAAGSPNSGGNLGGSSSQTFSGTTAGCNVGYHWNQTLGTCVVDDVTSWLPGGTPATTGYGTPITGSMGAVAPRQVGSVQRNDGRVTPLWRCPRGMVLGVDYNCYWKQLLPRQWRASPPARRPLLSAHDGMILNKAKTLEKKLRKVTNKHVHKPCHCKTGAPRRKK